MTAAGVRRIVQIMTLLQGLTSDYQNFSWHLHVSGHDTKGHIFWLPVFEDKEVLESSAKRVLDHVYRFVESGSAMVTGAASELSGSRGSRLRRPKMLDPRAALGGGVPSANGSDMRRRKLASSASVAAAGRAAPSSSVTALPGVDHDVGEVDAEVRAAAAAAAVVDAAIAADQDDGDDDSADAFIRAAVAGLGRSPSVAHATVAGTAVAAAGMVTDAAGAVTAAANYRSSSNVFSAGIYGASASRTTTALGGEKEEGGEEEENEKEVGEAAASSSRAVGALIRRATPSMAPVVAREPAEMAPSRDTLKRVNTLLDLGNVRTHLRALMPVLGNAIADAMGVSVGVAKTRLDWWPRKDDKEVWSLRIQLPYEVRKRSDKRTRPDPFARPKTVSLPSFFCQRDRVTTDTRLAHLVLMLEMEESARASFDAYLSMTKPKELGGGRQRQPPSLSSLGSLRAAPRLAPSAAEFASRQVLPLPDGATFYSTPI